MINGMNGMKYDSSLGKMALYHSAMFVISPLACFPIVKMIICIVCFYFVEGYINVFIFNKQHYILDMVGKICIAFESPLYDLFTDFQHLTILETLDFVNVNNSYFPYMKNALTQWDIIQEKSKN